MRKNFILVVKFIFKIIKLFSIIFIIPINNSFALLNISNLDDLNAGIWDSTATRIELDDDLCVFSDTGVYNITAIGSAVNGAFRVESVSDFINYSVRWNDQANTSSLTVLTRNVPQSFTTSETIDPNCNAGSNLTAHLQVRYSSSQLQQATPGSYSGTLTLTVEP